MKRTRDDDTAILEPMPREEPAPLAEYGLPEPADSAAEQDRDDGLAAELAKAAPKRWWDRGTLVLGGLALILAGFLGGIGVQKHYGASATPAGTATGRGAGAYGGFGRGAGTYGGGFPAGAAANGGGLPTGAAPSAAAPATTGTVKLVDGGTIYLQTVDGTVVTVRTSGSTAVRTARVGSLKDIKAGDTVSVRGATGTDGTVAATSVTADTTR